MGNRVMQVIPLSSQQPATSPGCEEILYRERLGGTIRKGKYREKEIGDSGSIGLGSNI